ncbi:MAG: hypothetical protein Q8934_15620 [Bacillota bacterium]|nr:hypothetical protein [Bacillota bacterium]
MIDFKGISLPFSVTDLLDTGVGLLKIVGPFILLALCFAANRFFSGAIRFAFEHDIKYFGKESTRTRLKEEAESFGYTL